MKLCRCIFFLLIEFVRPLLTMSIVSQTLGNYRGKVGELLLGSGSFTRKLILRENGFQFRVIKPDVDEKKLGNREIGSSPQELVTLLANAKADAILAMIERDTRLRENCNLLLTADQVVTYQGTILEKPVDNEEARRFIRRYSRSSCSTVGSIALTDLNTNKRVVGVDSSTIHFQQIPDDIIESIIAEGNCIHCAGGLMVEHELLAPYIERVEGSQDSLMGLSCDLLVKLLNELYSS